MDEESKSKKFISVVIPPEYQTENCQDVFPNANDLVFFSQKDALNILKKFKNSRFKVFDNYNEAFKHSLENSFNEENLKKLEIDNLSNGLNNLNKSLSKPSTPQLSYFRKMIEKNDYEVVKDLINNPLYLINDIEMPVLLMEGPRYNCFHITCKFDRPKILKLVLDKISNKDYLKNVFLNDKDEIASARVENIVNSYLNNSDKVNLDSPLHLACKFGSYECVKILLNCDSSLKGRLNNNKQTPFDTICSRKGDLDLKKKIQHLFKLEYYLPIIRILDKEVIIGKPTTKKPNKDEVSAIAGPMELNIANNLYEKLKSPRYRSKEEIAIRLSDYSKGIERIARNHCKAIGVKWEEYWPFLKQFTNFYTDEGLKLLENHFLQKSLGSCFKNPKKDEDVIMVLSEVIERFCITEKNDNEVFYTPPTSPIFHKKPKDIYINGDRLSEDDINVYISLKDVYINENEYPLITSWIKNMLNYDKMQKENKLNDSLNFSKYKFNLNSSKLNYDLNNSSLNLSENLDSSLIIPEKVILKELVSPLK